MNNLKTSRVLALIVALAMVLAVVPGFVASAEAIKQPVAAVFSHNMGDNGQKPAANLESFGDDFNNFKGGSLRDGYAVIAIPADLQNAENLKVALTVTVKERIGGFNPASAPLSYLLLEEEASVITQDNAIQYVNSESKAYTDAGAVLNIPNGNVGDVLTSEAFIVAPNGAKTIIVRITPVTLGNGVNGGGKYYGVNDEANKPYATLEAVEKASVVVKYACNGEEVATAYTVENLIAGEKFTPVAYDVYASDDKAVYAVGTPEEITLEAGENVAKIPVTVYKTIDSKVEIANPSFENGFEGVLNAAGETIAEGDRYAIVNDNVTDGESALWTKDVSGDTQIHTAWTVEPGRYAITFDAMATKGTAQYAWAYADAAEGGKYVTSAEYKNNDNGHINLLNGQFLSKTLVIKANGDQDVIGWAGAWFNDGAPVWDNFAVYKLNNLEGEVDYTIVYTTDGTADGTVLAKEYGEGKTGDEVTVEAGKIGDVLAGTKVYTNSAATIKLEKDGDTYYVGATAAAEIDSVPESVGAFDVNAGEKPELPKTVKATFTDEKEYDVDVEWAYTIPEAVDTMVAVEATGTVEGIADTVAATIYVFPADSFTVSHNANSGDDVRAFDKDYSEIEISFDLVALKDSADATITFGQNYGNGQKNVFGAEGDAISLQFGKGFNVRTWANNEEGKWTGTYVIQDVVPEPYKIYNVVITSNVADHKYDITISDKDGEVASAKGVTYRNNSSSVINALTAYNNNDNAKAARIFNLKYSGVSVGTAVLGFEGEDLTINFAVDAADAATATITSNATTEALETVNVADGDVIAVKAANANVTYTVTVAGADGKVLAIASSALYPLAIADLAANLEEYAADGEIARVEAALKVVNEGGFVIDANDLIKSIAEVTANEDGSTTVKIKDELYKLGIGFKATKAGMAGKVNDVTVEGQEITINADGTVALNGVEILSLESVEIEFVETEVADADAADADAELDFIPEI